MKKDFIRPLVRKKYDIPPSLLQREFAECVSPLSRAVWKRGFCHAVDHETAAFSASFCTVKTVDEKKKEKRRKLWTA